MKAIKYTLLNQIKEKKEVVEVFYKLFQVSLQKIQNHQLVMVLYDNIMLLSHFIKKLKFKIFFEDFFFLLEFERNLIFII